VPDERLADGNAPERRRVEVELRFAADFADVMEAQEGHGVAARHGVLRRGLRRYGFAARRRRSPARCCTRPRASSTSYPSSSPGSSAT
jgi:glycogen debranching enzyme-like protein